MKWVISLAVFLFCSSASISQPRKPDHIGKNKTTIIKNKERNHKVTKRIASGPGIENTGTTDIDLTTVNNAKTKTGANRTSKQPGKATLNSRSSRKNGNQ